MQNQLMKAQQPIGELMGMAKAFAESGMFADTKSAAQAIVKIQAGQEIGIPPFAAMTGIHIIQGKPTLGANLIAGRVKASGKYDYKVIEQRESVCSIDFFEGKEKIGNSTFTIEQAKKAGTKNIDKFPANMLFARAISNGVRWYCPDIFSGAVYTEHEIHEIHEIQDIDYEEDKTDKKIFENPPISEKALKDACTRLERGEIELPTGEQFFDKLLNTYSFDEQQRNRLNASWQIGCKEADKKLEEIKL